MLPVRRNASIDRFFLTMHPWISGRAGRLLGLEQLIRTIKAEPNVWWATCQQVAEWQIETRQNLDVTVPGIPTS